MYIFAGDVDIGFFEGQNAKVLCFTGAQAPKWCPLGAICAYIKLEAVLSKKAPKARKYHFSVFMAIFGPNEPGHIYKCLNPLFIH